MNFTFEEIRDVTFPWRALLYIVHPAETTPADLESAPDYVAMIVPYFFVLILFEGAVCQYSKRLRFRLNDGITSMSHAITLRVFEFIGEKNIEYITYWFVYETFRIFTFKNDWYITWILAMLGTDHSYYWAHRMMHEVNIIWATHQVHHSGEDYNLAMSMRQGLFQRYFTWPFYLPMAFIGIPTEFFITHQGLNLLYQFWIHTELVDGLGDTLNYVMNVPKHHQVHHGRNPYCVDKNYGGALIIWDRIYGTFADRDKDVHYENEKIAYGLIPPVNSFSYFKIQFHSYQKLFKKVARMDGIGNKMRAIFYGPGWSDKHKTNLRMGDPADLPKIKPNDELKFYDPFLSWNIALYTFFQKLTGLAIFDHMLNTQSEPLFTPASEKYSLLTGGIAVVWIFWTHWSIGELCSSKLMLNEIFRTFVTGLFFLSPQIGSDLIRLPNALSIAFFVSSIWAILIYKTPRKLNKVE